MQPRIVSGDITGLAEQGLRLGFAAIAGQHGCAQGAAVAFGAFQANFDPVVAFRRVVAQQRRRLVLVHDENVEIAVVVEIAKGAAAAGVMLIECGTGQAVQDPREGAVAIVAVK